MSTQSTGPSDLTVSAAPQVQGSSWGATDNRRVAIEYPTAERLRTRVKGCHGTAEERLARAYIVETNGCWRWVKGLTTVGYGHFSIASVYYQAHRLLYILRFGADIPAGLFPDHLCRHRWCVNPDHLEPVTHRENIRRGAGTVVTADEVEMILADVASGISQRKVAKARGIDHSTVSRIVRGERWGDVGVRTVAA